MVPAAECEQLSKGQRREEEARWGAEGKRDKAGISHVDSPETSKDNWLGPLGESPVKES